MSESISFDIKFNVVDGKINAAIDNITGGFDKINGKTLKLGNQFGKTVDSINKKISAIHLSSILDQVDRVSQGLSNLAAPGVEYSSALADLSAITGQTGEDLSHLGDLARDNAKHFGGDAAKSVETFKLLLSQLGPDLAKTPQLLHEMSKGAETMSKTMKGDVVGATEVITTAMNQYAVDMSNPVKATETMKDMMNSMSASAKEGSSELPVLKNAINEVGGDAKRSGVKFNSMLSSIQQLDKGGKKGASGGIALRNVMASLNQGRFLPKDVQKELAAAGVDINLLSDKSLSFTDRLRELEGVAGDTALMSKLFGKENQGSAQILINTADAQDKMTAAITGTNTAYQQADTIMDSPAEKMARQQAKAEDLKVSLFNMTNGWLGYVSVLGTSSRDIMNIIPLFVGMGSVISTLTSKKKLNVLWDNIGSAAMKVKAVAMGVVTGATWLWNTAQWALNAALWANPVTWIVLGIIALIASIIYLITQIEGWGEMWDNVLGAMGAQWDFMTGSFVLGWLYFQDLFMQGVDKIKIAWYKLKGLWDKDGAKKEIIAIREKAAKRKTAINAQKDKVVGSAQKMVEYSKKAVGSLSFKKDDKTSNSPTDIIPENPIQAGIKPPAGNMGTDVNNPPSGSETDKAGKSGSKTNKAIATGGAKSVNITINLKNMVEAINIKARDFKDSAKQMEEQTTDAMLRTLAMANMTAG